MNEMNVKRTLNCTISMSLKKILHAMGAYIRKYKFGSLTSQKSSEHSILSSSSFPTTPSIITKITRKYMKKCFRIRSIIFFRSHLTDRRTKFNSEPLTNCEVNSDNGFPMSSKRYASYLDVLISKLTTI